MYMKIHQFQWEDGYQQKSWGPFCCIKKCCLLSYHITFTTSGCTRLVTPWQVYLWTMLSHEGCSDYTSNTLASLLVENTAGSDNFNNLNTKGIARKVSSSSGIMIVGKLYLLTPSQSKEIKVRNFQKFMRRGNKKQQHKRTLQQINRATTQSANGNVLNRTSMDINLFKIRLWEEI